MSGIVKTAIIRSYPIHSSGASQPNTHKFGNDVDIQIFSDGGVWLKPPTATMVYIEAIGAGGGGGGGSESAHSGGEGGSGIILIRYEGSPAASGGTETESGGYTYHAYTSTGSATFTTD